MYKNQPILSIGTVLRQSHQDLLHMNRLGKNSFWQLNHGNHGDFLTESELFVSPNEQSQVSQYKRTIYVEKNHTYLLYAEISCTSYQKGKLGIGINGYGQTLSLKKKSDGYVPMAKTITFKESGNSYLFIGGLKQADLSGNIRNCLLLDITKVYEGSEPIFYTSELFIRN
ncbi:hypothetical protein IGI37_003207 [Enterococcus sp. AZ194]|uniref:hypothetical protein n=1 Tax=Enterococcus sp. AZ194 TaxID=2774629 RepID=UPI003F245629